MKRAAIGLVLTLACTQISAQETRYAINPTYTSVRFTIVKWGVIKDEGLFRDFSGTLLFDPAHPGKARIDVVVQAASIDTKNDSRDATVRSPDFLDAARYPTLEFHSKAIEQSGGRTFVTGNMTIHGVTKRIRFAAASLGMREVPRIGKLAGFEATFTLNRRDYNVDGTRWGAVPAVLSDTLEIHIIIGAVAH